MAVYTNITRRLINLPDGTQCIPGQACEVSDDMSGNEGFKAMVDAGEIVSGEVAPDKLDEARAEAEQKAAEAVEKRQQQQPAQPNVPQQPAQQPTPQRPAPQQQQPTQQQPTQQQPTTKSV